VGLAGWLEQQYDAPVTMTAREFSTAHQVRAMPEETFIAGVADFFRRNGLDEARLKILLDEGNTYAASVWELPEKHERLAHGDEVEIGGRAWRVIVGEGHAPEQATLYCDALKVLIAGDMILPEITPNISTEFFDAEANPLKDYLDSLERYAGLPNETLVLPSHRLPFQGLKTRSAQLRAHHEERLDRCRRALSGGPKTAADLLEPLFERRLDGYGVFFAMGEAIAHLDYLVARGEARREARGDTLIYRI
jgi:glyoxylase-like metal-dependent hydrolase (beta-lactamase superfamily II)